MEDHDDGDSDAEMADYGTDSSDDVDPKAGPKLCPSLLQLMLGRHSGIGNRIPRFPGFWGDFPIPDSAENRESESRFGEPGISWSAHG